MKKKENLLIEDIKRNLQLMGITQSPNIIESMFSDKNILTESSILKKLMIDVFDGLKPQKLKVANNVEKYVIGGTEVDNAFFNSFKRLKDDFDANWPRFISNPGYASKLADILRQNPTIVKAFYDDLMTDFILRVPGIRSERNFYKLLKKKEDAIIAHNKANPNAQLPAFDVDNELKTMITDSLERETLIPMMKKNYDQFKKGEFKSTVYPKKPDVPTIKLTNRQIANFKKVVSTSSRYWNNIYQVFTKNLDDLRLDIEGLSKGYIESCKNTTDPEQLKDLANAYAVQISNKLSLMESKMKNSALDLLEEEGIPDEVLQVLKNDQNTFFKMFRESIQASDETVSGYVDLITESITRNFQEISTFIKKLFSKNAFDAVKHLLNPRSDLGTWFYTNQWAGLNKLFQLAVKNGAFESNKAFWTKFIPKVLIATNIGFLTGWLAKAGLMTIVEEVFKPLYNLTFGSLHCALMKFFGKATNCDDFKFDMGEKKSLEYALLSRFVSESIEPIGEQYKESPSASAIFRLLPIINYLETYRHSMATKVVEGITGRELFLNMVGDSPENATQEIKNNAGPGADSIMINWDDTSFETPIR